MKENIHPAYDTITVTCSCGVVFETRSTLANKNLHIDVCSKCHPFYTGKQKLVDTGGRIDRFRQRYANKEATVKQEAAAPVEKKTKSKAKAKTK